jgi:hypothetical protein
MGEVDGFSEMEVICPTGQEFVARMSEATSGATLPAYRFAHAGYGTFPWRAGCCPTGQTTFPTIERPPEWPWPDIRAHLRRTMCGSAGWLDPRRNLGEVISDSKGI